MQQNPLIGKTLIDIQLASDGGAIKFVTDQGEIIARADGDCCSTTWIESVELPALGLPAKVSAVEDLDLGEREDEEYECLAFYGCKIDTDKGSMTIDYRNESNGYYGGNLSWPGDHFYGGVFGQNISKEEWQPVRDAG